MRIIAGIGSQNLPPRRPPDLPGRQLRAIVAWEQLLVSRFLAMGGRGEHPMDDAAAMYRLRAEECLALALEARDEVHRTGAIEMVLYCFEQAENTYAASPLE